MRRFARLLRSADSAMLGILLAVSALLWCVRVQGPASHAVDPFGNSDQYNYFYPLHRAVAERLRAGELPLWNARQLAGAPLLATPQAGVFYPPNLLHVWMPTERVFELLAFAHLCWAAWLMYGLCRSLGAQPAVAAIGGASYAWSSYVVGCHLWPPCLAALAWFPLPLLGTALLERAPARSALCTALGVAALLVCGHYPLALFGLQAAAAYAAFSCLRLGLRAGARAALSGSLRVGLAALAGVLLAAPQWLPTLELVQLATRSSHGLTAQQLEPFGPLSGSVLRALFAPAARGGGYAGAMSLLLLPLAALMPRPALRTEAVFFAALAMCFALLSLGSSTPLYALYTYLPGARLFRGPVRAMCVFVLGGSVSAALCLDGLFAVGASVAAAATGRARAHALVFSVLGLAALALLLLVPQLSAAVVIASALAIGAVALVPSRWRPGMVAAVGCIVLADLTLIPSTPDRQIWRAGALDTLARLEAPYRELSRQLGAARCLVEPARRHPLATAPRVAAQFGLRVFEDYEPLSLQRYADYAAFLQRAALYDPDDPVLMYAGGLDRRAPWLQPRLLAAAGVRAIARVQQGADSRPGLRITWLPDALPRTYLVHDVRPAQSATATLRALGRGELGRDAVVIEHAPAGLQNGSIPSGPERVKLTRDEPERVVIDATLTAPGALVLLDAHYPGWRATVNGVRTRIYPANYLFRAVLLPAGQHRVVFEYVSWPVRVGLGLCALGLLLVTMLVARQRRRAEAPQARAPAAAPSE